MSVKRRRAEHGSVMLFLLAHAPVIVGCAIVAAFVWRAGEDEADEPEPYPPYIGERYPEDAHPTEMQKMWALAAFGVLTELNKGSHYFLGTASGSYSKLHATLKRSWGIDSKDSLMGALRGLECGGHRAEYDEWLEGYEALDPDGREQMRLEAFAHGGAASNKMDVVLATRERFMGAGLAGWDFSRYIWLCDKARYAGYLTEEEVWTLIMPVARLLQNTFSSWHDLVDNYVEGRRFWSLRTHLLDGEEARDGANRLKWKPESPCWRLPWKLNLLPEEQKDDGSREFRLGRVCFDMREGRTVEESRAEALRLFRAAAEKGSVDAMYWLGLCHGWGWQGLKKSKAEATAWLLKAAERGDVPALCELARLHVNDSDPAVQRRVFEWVSRALEAGGMPVADSYMGFLYERGIGVEKSLEKAFEWYGKAARKGEPWGQTNYGGCFRDGNGVEKDMVKAAEWHRKGAESGFVPGMVLFAELLERGEGVAKDEAAALRWYRKAAAKGNAKAKARLGAGGGGE